MKHAIKNIGKSIRRHYIISGLTLLVIIFVGYGMTSGGVSAETFTVKKGSVVQKVIVTGSTKPVHTVALGFEKSGKVSTVYAGVGSRVYTGQALVAIDSSELSADLSREKANLLSEEAKLSELKRGTRPEEIAIAQTDVENAKIALVTKMLESYTTSDDAVHNAVDQVFTNPRSLNPEFSLTIANSQLRININSGRAAVEPILLAWQSSLSSVSPEGAQKVKTDLSQIKIFVDNVAAALNAHAADSSTSQSTLDAYRTAVSTARTSINSVVSAVASAEATLLSAQKVLSLKQGGSIPEVIKAQEARVLQIQAQVQSVEAQLGKTILRSPQNGIITKQDAKTGEIVTSGKILVSIISDNNLEIESNVSEVSIGKVKLGNLANIVFDAFPGQTFLGVVTYIEPAETVVDGVVNYKVTIGFSKNYPEIKSGLTSKLEIATASKENVIVIPQYALVSRDGNYFVKVGEKELVERPITLGLFGQDGFVEVISGLSEGETIQAVVQ